MMSEPTSNATSERRRLLMLLCSDGGRVRADIKVNKFRPEPLAVPQVIRPAP